MISVEVVSNFLRQPVRALILHSYGVGNAPQHPALHELKQADYRSIVMLNLMEYLSGRVNMGDYATGNTLGHTEVLSDFDMTLKAAMTKLHFLLSQSLANRYPTRVSVVSCSRLCTAN